MVVRVLSADGSESDMWLSQLINCQELYTDFINWINNGQPRTAQGRPNMNRSSVGERSFVHMGFPTDTLYTFRKHKDKADCLVLAHDNAAAALRVAGGQFNMRYLNQARIKLKMDRVSIKVLIYAMSKRHSRLRIGKSVLLSHDTTRKQPLPKPGVFIGIAISQYNERHSFAIDNLDVDNPVLLDGYNEAPVVYNEEAMQWVKNWSRLWEVVATSRLK